MAHLGLALLIIFQSSKHHLWEMAVSVIPCLLPRVARGISWHFKTHHNSGCVRLFLPLGRNTDLLGWKQKPTRGNESWGGPSEAGVLTYAYAGNNEFITSWWANSGCDRLASFWSGLPFLLWTTRCQTFTAKLQPSACTMERPVYALNIFMNPFSFVFCEALVSLLSIALRASF